MKIMPIKYQKNRHYTVSRKHAAKFIKDNRKKGYLFRNTLKSPMTHTYSLLSHDMGSIITQITIEDSSYWVGRKSGFRK